MRLAQTTERSIHVGRAELHATVSIPEDACGVVLFAHGSGSSRFSPPGLVVAAELLKAGVATVLVDLLTLEEEAVDLETAHPRFDIALLAGRLERVTGWLARTPDTAHLPVGYFGAGVGAAAALLAAAARPGRVRAVVSRSGRPDLAGQALARVLAPTLLIVGERDPEVRALNEGAMARMCRADVTLRVVSATGPLFEEQGALAEVAALSREFLTRHLARARPKAVAG
jgi:putative phosphoribosyl transferase